MNNVKTIDMLQLAANQKLKEKNYWLNKLSGDLVKSSFPFDFKQPLHDKSISGYENLGEVNFNLSGKLYKSLMQLSKSSDTVLHMVLTAGLIILIEKYTGNHDIIVGSPIYKQDVKNDFLNTVVALRTILKEEMTFKELLGDVRKTIIESHENQNYPIEILPEQLNLPAISEDDFPLFDIVILVENIHDKKYIQNIYNHVVFSFLNTGNQITGTVEYSILHYSEATIKRIVKHFNILFERVLPALDTRISLIDILAEDERKQLLFDFNDTGSDCPKDKTLITLFAEQVGKNPDRIAVVGTGTSTVFPHVSPHVSYKELNNKSNRLGHLLQAKGIGPDNIVGILIDRSIEMMIMILGVLTSGGAYLPIETETPLKRLSAMLDDCGAQIILTTCAAAETYPFTLLQNLRQTKDIPVPVFTGLRPQIIELDRLPIPDRGLVNYEQYHKFIGLAPVKHAVSIQGTRGCPYNCLYCHKIWPKKHVFRSAENIFEEIRKCYQHGIKRFAYVDDILNLNIENSSKLFALIIKNKMKLHMFFPNGVRGDILTESYIDLMMEAGTIDLMMALESASPRIQKLVRKNLNLEKFEKNLQYIIKHYPNVNLEMNIMVGFPTETEEEALMSLEFLERHKWVHFPNLNLLKIYPNTDMYHLALQNGVSDEAITRSADLAYHQLPETLPFSKNFTHKYQTRFLDEYFLAKERLLYVLPYQMKILTEDELVQKYDSYLPVKINSFADILEFTKISKEELGKIEFLPADFMAVPDFTPNYRKSQPSELKDDDAYRILFLDLSLFFSKKSETELYAVVEPPLGFLYLLTDLNQVFKNKINGKIIKSNIDFDNYEELRILINEFKPDLIGVRSLSYYKEFFHTTVSLIRQWGVVVPIIAGGPYATSDYSTMLMDYNVNLAVLGEGELTLRELVEKIFANNRKFPGEESLKDIKGIAFVKDKDKALLKQKKREIILLDNLDLSDDQAFVEHPKTVCQASDLSYVVFTSGSTGIPKGTLISNRNVVRLVKNTNYIDLNKEDRVLQLSNYAFDGSVFDIYGSFLNSSTLVLMKKEEVIAADYLADRIKKEAITVFFVTTALFNLIADIEIECLKNVRKILFGGERVSVDFVKKAINYLGKNKILHMYGPTETTVYATAYSIENIDESLGTVPIGGPISETQIHILDNNQKITPIGVVGEIYIGGIGVSRGYLNRPEITAEKFIENPYLTPGKGISAHRLYRTGDLARWLKEGIIEFIGRIDHQVKIRGFRIELGEIENILLKHPYINEAVVIVSQETVSGFQDKILCAYIVSNQTLSIPDLKEEISNELPPYMMPTYFMQLNKIPLTANGKVDRKALPNPISKESNKGYIPPGNDEEIALVEIWSEVLGIEKNLISVHDDFFQIGGQSLKVMILISKIHEKLNVKVPISEFFKYPTIKMSAIYIKKAVPHTFDSIKSIEKKEYYTATPAQKRLYILQQMEKNSILYNVPIINELEGKLDLNKFTDVFNRLIIRHESLRTFFGIVNGNIVQRIMDWPEYDKCAEPPFHINYYEFKNSEAFKESGLKTTLIKHFDLSKAPLMRVCIIKIGEMNFILAVDIHHIVMDGVSLGILLKDFDHLYKNEELSPLRVQYKDFSEWQLNNNVRKAIIEKQEQYWLDIFSEEIPVLNLPFDYPPPPIMSFEGENINFTFDSPETELLNKIAFEENTTMFIVLLTLFNCLLGKISSQDDLIVGTVTAGRDHTDLKSIIGMFVNTIPLRNHPQGEMTFKEFLSEVKETTLKAFENQDYPFEELVEKINIERNININPVFDVMFILQNFETPILDIPGLKMKPFLYEDKTAKFNLTLTATESEGNIFFSIQYKVNLFSKDTIGRLICYLKKALCSILKNREIGITRIEMIPDQERNRILNDFNNTSDNFSFDFDKPIHRLFEEQVERNPDYIALVGTYKVKETPLQHQITYRRLNNQSNQLANLVIEKAIQPGNVVAIIIERSVEMIAGILGILKAGSAYLPIDPGLPTERINYMLKDANVKLIINEMFFRGFEVAQNAESAVEILPKDLLREFDFSLSFQEDPLAYIIYTSGTTGRPKGILIKHNGIVNFASFHKELFDSSIYLRASQTSNQNFDAMSFEVWPALTRGVALYITPDEIRADPSKLKQWLIKNKITASFQSTAIATALLDEKWSENETGLKILWTAGDKLTKYLKHPYPFRFFNLYGPTEDTVWTTWTEIEVVPDQKNIPGIGKPIANHTVYIIDSNSMLQPIGSPGELCIGGVGLARGYLNRPELSYEKFRPLITLMAQMSQIKNKSFFGESRDPRGAGGLLELWKKAPLVYKTGDLAKWRSDGNIEFLGRIDQQVKIRGFRIELAEIESLLANHKGIKEVIVVARQDNEDEKYLCAYLVSSKQYPITELQKYLAGNLPAYMIPSYFVYLEKIPLTPNGKVDRKALPKPELNAGQDYVSPRDRTETKLVELWADVLNIQPSIIGIDKNFFELGGHSLKATVLASRIHKEFNVILPLAELFKTPTIRGLSKYISGKVENIYESIMPVEEKEYYGLSFTQQRMYILQQIDLSSTAYNMPQIIPLPEEIDIIKLEASFNKLIMRHDSLRTSFHMLGDCPVQKIHQEVDFKIENLSLATGSTEAKIHHFIQAFELSLAPLMRVGYIKTAEGKQYLLVDLHHIISDGISNQVLREDFMAFNNGKELPPLRIQYKDFAQWQNSPKEIERLEQQEQFWLKEFEGEIPVLEIPLDYPRPVSQSFAGNSINFEISAKETRSLKDIALQSGATLFMVLAAAVNILLSKLSGQEEIIIGSPIAGRRHSDLEKIIGIFINTLAIKNYPLGQRTFEDFLAGAKERMLKIFENQEYPFETLVDKLALKRDMGRNPLFDVMFVLQNMTTPSTNVDDKIQANTHRTGQQSQASEFENIVQTAKFDLTFTAIEIEQKIIFSIQYCTKLFNRETIERFITYFQEITQSIIDKPGIQLKDIDVVPGKEKEQLLYIFNETKVVYPENKTIHELFEEQASRTPDHIAVSGKPSRLVQPVGDVKPVNLTYNQLNEQSDRLAGLLIEKGIVADDIVGIMMERSVEMIIGLLGILKSGAAYLPLNPRQPESRTLFMVKDSGTKLLAVANDQEGEKVRRWEGEKIILESAVHNSEHLKGRPEQGLHHSAFRIQRSNLAYVIYTSGSTGNPKGVPITHGNFSPLVHWGYRNMEITPVDRFLQNLSYFFDWSVWEIFLALTTGAGLYITNEDILLDGLSLGKFINDNKISVLHITPSQFQVLVGVEIHGKALKLESLSHLCLGAEKLTYDLLKRSLEMVSKDCRIYNMYGPTEATIIAAILEIDRGTIEEYENLNSVPIGVPVGNTQLYILDKYFKLCPLNVVGELYIGGQGLSNGYINNPELTNQKFLEVSEPFFKKVLTRRGLQHSKLYRTGDLSRWLPGGVVEFLGRIDLQVKIRGYRIELGEIENNLLEHEQVKAAVVIVRRETDLCAYIVPSEPGVDGVDKIQLQKELKEYLSDRLPGYMVPAFIVLLQSLPLTPNGKVDLGALRILPDPESLTMEEYTAPRDEVEEKLVRIWSEILGREKGLISVNADFFDLGGHSLKATVLASRIHKELNVVLPLAQLFTSPTIRGLSEYVRGSVKNIYESIMPVEEKEYYVLSFAQQRMYILQQIDPNSTAYNIPQIIPLNEAFNIVHLEEAFKKLIKRHESLRTSFHMIDNQPLQRIHGNVEFKIERLEDNEQGIGVQIRAFDLSKAPLMRVGYSETGDGKQYLLVDMHHIISDGISNQVLREDFMSLYEGKELPSLRIQYKDFAQWQNRPKEVERLHQQMQYWLKEFEGEIPVLEIPLDYPRPISQSFAGNSINFEISAEQTRALNDMALQGGATLFMVLTAVVNILLSKLSGQEKIIIGSPIAGRRHADLEKIIGMFVNTLAIKNYPIGQRTFGDFLAEVKERMLKIFENQEYPFETLVDKLALKRDMGRNPLFDVMFVLQNMNTKPGRQTEQSPQTDLLKEYRDTFQAAKFDLTFTGMEIGQNILFSFQYCTKLFKKDSIECFITYFKKIISTVLNNPKARISEIDIISPEEKQQVLHDFNDTKSEYPGEKMIHQLFEEQAGRTPDYIAISTRPARLTYHALQEQSNGLAYCLKEKGVVPDSIAAIKIERSIEMLIGIFGILKAGAAYLPIDPGYPRERIDYMLNDSGAKLLVVANDQEDKKVKRWEGELLAVANESEVEKLRSWEGEHQGLHHSPFDMPLIPRNHHSNLAYVIYTSGSTGTPKGVMIEHRSVVNRLNWMQKLYSIDAGDVILQKTTFTFDVSVWELFWWSFQGACVNLLAPGEEKDPAAIVQSLATHCITTMHFVPSMLNAFLGYLENENVAGVKMNELRRLRQVFASGEALNPMQVERFYRLFDQLAGLPTRLINLYGPTEATVDVSYFNCSAAEKYEQIPIGKPIDNINLFILDKDGHLQPIGVVGELHITGVGLARGYLNRPDLTREKFIMPSGTGATRNPFEKGFLDFPKLLFNDLQSFTTHYPLLYKTGDLVRWLKNGNIEYLGRIDHQVKVRGFRIELGEIENRLLSEPVVKEAVVTARTDRSGDIQLAAYVVPDETVAFTVLRLVEIERNGLQADRPYYEFPNGMPIFYLNRNETDFMYREIFAERSYLKHGITLPAGSCIFDIGANIGIFSLFANYFCPNAKIYSFEPAPPLYELLALNTSLYGTNFQIFKTGISSKEEEVVFTYYPHASILSGRFADDAEEKETVKAFIHQELEAGGEEKPAEEQIDELLAERLSGVRFDCVMKTISQVMRENSVERIDLLKIDVEKAELDVLAGIDAEDWPKIQQLVIEVHDSGGRLNKITALLEKHGYKVAVEQDSMLEKTGLYNLYAILPGVQHLEQWKPTRDRNESAVYGPARLIDDLKESLKNQLPSYMIPSHFVLLDKIPLTASGKVDRNALPNLKLKAGQDYVPPGNPTEAKLVGWWAELLNIQPEVISIDRSFFELGGHSLKATVLASRIHKELNVIVPLSEIFKAPTIRDLGNYIRNSRTNIQKDIDWNLVLIKENPIKNNHLFFIHDGSGEVEGYLEFCQHLSINFNCWGIRADRLDNLAPQDVTIEKLAKSYIDKIKKIQPAGPYYIIGWSLGGTIAFEMAAQLEQTNAEIAFLALIDSPPPHKNLWKEALEFNLKSELHFVKDQIAGIEVEEKLKTASELSLFWSSIVEYLETKQYDAQMIKNLIRGYGFHALPNYDQLGIRESIYYLNVGRTLSNARAHYIPRVKLNSQVHYFQASQSKNIAQQHWGKYCLKPIKYDIIFGDHFSIFRIPQVIEFVRLFDNCFPWHNKTPEEA